jgi:hypothetical protein
VLDGPCVPWDFSLPCDLAEASEEQVALVVEAATAILWAAGGRRHGLCPVVLRPCGTRPRGGSWPEWGHGYTPVLAEGVWLNLCGLDDGCGGLAGLRLDAAPLSSVVEVTVDGVVLGPWDPEAPDVDGWTYSSGVLFRVGGTWPTRQDLALPLSEPGTFGVEVLAGIEPDALALLAAADLACELLKGVVGDESCALPSTLVGLVRQGVSMTFADPSVVLADGRVGLRLADMWIEAVNPGRLPRRPAVYSPDRMPSARG